MPTYRQQGFFLIPEATPEEIAQRSTQGFFSIRGSSPVKEDNDAALKAKIERYTFLQEQYRDPDLARYISALEAKLHRTYFTGFVELGPVPVTTDFETGEVILGFVDIAEARNAPSLP